MKIKRGDVLMCGPECGCGMKVVVIEECAEGECDLKCCGKEMVSPGKKEGNDAWRQYCKEPAGESWEQHAKSGKK